MSRLTEAVLQFVRRGEGWVTGLWLIRLLVAAMFAESALDKILHWSTYVADATAHHIPGGSLALGAAAAVEALTTVALLTGWAYVPALLAAAGYTFVVNVFYFHFWDMPMPDAVGARKEFLKDLAVIGGLLALLRIHLQARAGRFRTSSK